MRRLEGIIDPMDVEFDKTLGDSEVQEAWCAAVYGVAKSWTQLSD